MTAKQGYRPKTEWDQDAFEDMRASWSPARIAEDKKLLKNIFNKAAVSPLLAEEIAWAKEHGIEFFVDRTAVNCGGYYMIGTGVVAVSYKYASQGTMTSYVAGTLAHELRHAWQDYHGLIACDDETPKVGYFSRFFINNAMIEADASAYGNRVRAEVQDANMSQCIGEVTAPDMQRHFNDENVDLGRKFLSWFDRPAFGEPYPRFYGEYFSKVYGRKWGVYEGELPLRNVEFKFDKEIHKPGFDLNDKQDILRLGKNFSGRKNYLADMPFEILSKRVLRPSLARTFWGTANSNQRALSVATDRAYMEEIYAPKRVNGRLKPTRGTLPRHPWP